MQFFWAKLACNRVQKFSPKYSQYMYIRGEQTWKTITLSPQIIAPIPGKLKNLVKAGQPDQGIIQAYWYFRWKKGVAQVKIKIVLQCSWVLPMSYKRFAIKYQSSLFFQFSHGVIGLWCVISDIFGRKTLSHLIISHKSLSFCGYMLLSDMFSHSTLKLFSIQSFFYLNFNDVRTVQTRMIDNIA